MGGEEGGIQYYQPERDAETERHCLGQQKKQIIFLG